jgi:predicted DNA-binding transcriptional regulator AlpA
MAAAHLAVLQLSADALVMSRTTEADMTPSTKMRVPEAARYLGLAQSTLNKMRCFGGGPRFAKAGPRVVIYDRCDLDEWLEDRTCRSTSEYQRRNI